MQTTTTTIHLDSDGRHAGLEDTCRYCGEQFRESYTAGELRDLLDTQAADLAAELADSGLDGEELEAWLQDSRWAATTDEMMTDATLFVATTGPFRDGEPVSVIGYVEILDPATGDQVVEVETDLHSVTA